MVSCDWCVFFRMCRVCRLWRDVALSASLWYNIDLASPCIKDKYKTTETVRWLCENRLTRVQELNVGKCIAQLHIHSNLDYLGAD
jgi:hypothetical protein